MNNKQLLAFAIPSHLPGMGGWGNGYVGIPEGHPCFGVDYNEIQSIYDINVHGGLTFSGHYHGSPFPQEAVGMWIVGFDTLHWGDNMHKWPNETAVLAEANHLKEQLEKLIAL